MRLPLRILAPALSLLFLTASARPAWDKNPADYPLRLHIFSRQEHTRYHRGVQEASQGEGRANLYAGGEVHAVDFHFDCGEKIERSVGYETYMARWRKPGTQLEVLFPVFGKAGKFFTCTLDTDVKPDVAYYTHNGSIQEEPSNKFKDWMVQHQYDPEHGKEMPASAASTDPS